MAHYVIHIQDSVFSAVCWEAGVVTGADVRSRAGFLIVLEIKRTPIF